MNDNPAPKELNPQEVLDYLLKKFKFERIAYLSVTILSFFFLIFCGIILVGKDGKIEFVIGMFGSTGVIAYSCSQLLTMWKDSINFIQKYFENKK